MVKKILQSILYTLASPGAWGQESRQVDREGKLVLEPARDDVERQADREGLKDDSKRMSERGQVGRKGLIGVGREPEERNHLHGQCFNSNVDYIIEKQS